jgi:hypothetical protein
MGEMRTGSQNMGAMESFSGQRVMSAIHATKRPPKDLPSDLLDELPVLELDPSGLPLGAVLGTAVVTDFHRTELIVPSSTRRELAFGDYTSGSRAWRLDDVVMLPEAKVEDGVQC